MRKDDLITTVRTEGDWCFVENAITKAQGFVPPSFIAPNMSLSAEPWFFGHLSRQKVPLNPSFNHTLTLAQAEKLLANPMRKHGCFLIRESEARTTTNSSIAHVRGRASPASMRCR